VWNPLRRGRAGDCRHADLGPAGKQHRRYGATDYGEAFDKGVYAIIDAGHRTVCGQRRSQGQ
jgi:hypothetical protein